MVKLVTKIQWLNLHQLNILVFKVNLSCYICTNLQSAIIISYYIINCLSPTSALNILENRGALCMSVKTTAQILNDIYYVIVL